MILKVFGVLQFLVLVQIISAHLSHREVPSQNILKNLENTPSETFTRPSRQINDIPVNLPNNGNLPLNGLANGLPFRNGMPFGLPRGNNLPNNFAINNGVPNNLAWNNGMALPNNLPFLNRNIQPQNRLLPNVNGMTNNGLFNYLPNGLPINNPITNNLQNLINAPAGNNILNLNNLPVANTLPNNIQIPTGLPNINNSPCRNFLPPMAQNNGLPQNILPTGNLLPSINNQLPLNNFQNGLNFANRLADITRLPRNNLPVSSVNANANNLQNFNGLINNEMPQTANGLTNINNAPTVNSLMNSPNELPTYVSNPNGYQNANKFLNNNVMSNNVPYSNGLPVASNNLQNSNMMVVNRQQFVANPSNNGFGIPNNYATVTSNTNSLPINAINNNGGFINRPFIASGNSEIYNSLSSNNLQYSTVDMPVNNWQYDFGNANMPVNQDSLANGVSTVSNMPNDCQTTLTSNNFNLAEELVKNLQIEGVDNMPFLNGLPVAGITETVTVLNSPCS